MYDFIMLNIFSIILQQKLVLKKHWGTPFYEQVSPNFWLEKALLHRRRKTILETGHISRNLFISILLFCSVWVPHRYTYCSFSKSLWLNNHYNRNETRAVQQIEHASDPELKIKKATRACVALVVKHTAFTESLSHTLAHLLWWRHVLKNSLDKLITYIHSAESS